jgi:hypothetical protein
MASITTVRAALQALASEGWTPRTLFQLGSAMGPASLYVLSTTTANGVEPVIRTDSAARPWLQAFTTPHPQYFAPARSDRDLRFTELSGAALLRLAATAGRWLVLEATSPLECRIAHRTVQSLQVAAGYTESLVTGTTPHQAPARTRLRLAS